MVFLFKFPTRSRPEKFKSTLSKYQSLLSGKHEVKWCISCDRDDRTMNNYGMIKHLGTIPHLKVFFGDSKTKVQAINADMQHFQEGWQVLLLISDDMIPQVKGYDDIIAKHMDSSFPGMDGALHFNDGRTGNNINTLVIETDKLYRNYGYIYHPQYTSLWCDNEYTDVNRREDKLKYIDEVIIKHAWTDYTGPDVLHRRNEKYYEADKKIYERRKAAGFPKGNV